MTIAEKIVQFPHEVLMQKASMITNQELKGELKSILNEVKQYVEEDKGVAGLALPQIGISKKAFVAKIVLNNVEKTLIFINPQIRILPQDRAKKEKDFEGCLSISGEEFEVERFLKIQVFYRNENWKTMELKLSGRNARIVQHEFDHLNGVLISQIGEKVASEIAQ